MPPEATKTETTQKPATCYSMKHEGSRGEIMIYDDIGGGFFGGITAREFAEDLKAMGDVSQIDVRMNTQGGDAFEGIAIHSSLKNHPAHVNIDVDGLAGSVGSLILMAGDTRRIAGNAMVMLHEPMGSISGPIAVLEAKTEALRKLRDIVGDAYASGTGKTKGEIMTMMAEETWLTAAESLEHGFVDEVTGDMAVAAHVDANKMGFGKVPERFTAKAESPVTPVDDQPAKPKTPASAKEVAQRMAAHDAMVAKLENPTGGRPK